MRILAVVALALTAHAAPAHRLLLTVGNGVEIVGRSGTVQVRYPDSRGQNASGARFSPDGQRVAWVSGDGVHVAGANGSAARLVARGSAFAWSGDSRSLLITGTGPVQVYSLATGRLTTVVKARAGIFYFALGFAGGTPVYTRGTDLAGLDPFDVVVGSRVALRIGDFHYRGSVPTLSPDGGRVAFVWPSGKGDVIRVADLRTGAHHDIGGVRPSFWLSWSPDSTRLAFANVTRGRWQTEIVSAGGGVARAVGPGVVPVWVRDGELLIVRGTSYDQLWASDGSGPEHLLFHTPAPIFSVDAS
jgi:hypothetical protein